MKLRPLQDRVLIRRADADAVTAGGLHIPDTAQDRPTRGTVVETGPGKTLDDGRVLEPRVKTGDDVLIGKFTGQEVELGGETLLIAREDEILGVFES